MINYIYGVDYNKVVRGGRGNAILVAGYTETDLFLSEKELATKLSELQNDEFIINISPFVATLDRQKYELKFK